MFPIYIKYSAVEPAVSLIIPYASGKPFNPIYICENDEAIVVEGGDSIGHARIEGARAASNEWLLMMDSDAVYPEDYVLIAKEFIREYGDKYPVMSAKRKGGFDELFTKFYESGLIVRRDVFLERTKYYPRGLLWVGRRTDVWGYFTDNVKIDLEYYHDFTTNEKKLVSALIIAPAIIISMLP